MSKTDLSSSLFNISLVLLEKLHLDNGENRDQNKLQDFEERHVWGVKCWLEFHKQNAG